MAEYQHICGLLLVCTIKNESYTEVELSNEIIIAQEL